jgi:RHS repeat-associated protein
MARVTKETRANGSFSTYVYDATTGRLQSTTDPKQQVTTYTYGVDDTITSIAYSNAAIATPTVTMAYDPNYPRLAAMTDGIGTTTYAYVSPGTQGAGQPATVDGPLSNDTVSYTYDELGRQTTRTLNGVTTTWTFDTLGRIETEVDPIGTFTFAYDGVTSRLQQLAYPNGQTSTYSYSGNTNDRRLQEIHHQTGGGTTLSRFTYAYDRVGNITTWTQQYGADTKAYDFTYDGADQLTGAVYRTTDPTPTIVKRYGYTYDAAGNRTTARVDDAPVTYSYNNMNQLTAQAGGGVVEFRGTTNEAATVTIGGKPATGAGGTTFAGSATLPSGTSTVAVRATDASGNTATQSYDVDVPVSTGASSYDANGNRIAQGTKTYEWDAADRLVRVLDDGIEIARFAYDGGGRRVQKITGGTTRSYVYAGLDILEERTSSGTIRNVHGPGIDQLLASVDGSGTVSYYLADHLGSIVQQTNASASVTMTRQYDPYGVPLQGAATSGYAYTGREWDAEIGLHYYRSRYYDPALGRFISEDPVGLAAGPNLYACVNGNPIRYRDPLGLYGWNDALNSWVARALINDATANFTLGFASAATWGFFTPADSATWGSIFGVQSSWRGNTCSFSYHLGMAAYLAVTAMAAAPAAVVEEAVTAPFSSGEIIVQEFTTSKGTIEMAAEAVIDGSTLHLKEIAVYPRGAEAFELGTREVIALRNQLAAQARGMGFETLRITGTRLTGANPGKIVDVIINLVR